jgi:exosortase B
MSTAPTALPTRGRLFDLRLSPAAWLLWTGLTAMAVPTVWDLSRDVWRGDEQGHGPVILLVSLWLLWRKRHDILHAAYAPRPWTGGALLAFALGLQVVGVSQSVLQFEVLAPIVAGAALLLLARGWGALRAAALPLLFLVFIVPLPGILVQTVTMPLKMAVSWVAQTLLHGVGYPVARSGVIIAIDQYQLLVADACAGLTSMFTLEALGLMYMHMRRVAVSRGHDIALALLLIPIAFIANVLRVIVLILVTYYFGDAVGQGFAHGFAGVVLFTAAAVLLLVTDGLLLRLWPRKRAQAAQA